MVVDVACGRDHTCAVDTDGDVYCWGSNASGQLALGSQVTESLQPVQVQGLTSIVALAAGHDHTCALDDLGLAWCWGNNEFGQLGRGNATPSALPQTTTLQGVRTLSLAENRSCASDINGDVLCWGAACTGAACTPSAADVLSPASEGLTNIEVVATGDDHTCAGALGGVLCWGNNGSGQLGTGDYNSSSTPRNAGSGSITSLPMSMGAGDAATCIVTEASAVLCWGQGDAGELGNGGTDELADPVTPLGLPAMRSIATDGDTTCALAMDDDVYCWGASTGNSAGSSLVPVLVEGIQ